MENIVELEKLHVINIFDNESDGMSSASLCCDPTENTGVTYKSNIQAEMEKNGVFELERLCQGGHGLSLLLIGESNGIKHTLLFDAGPEPKIWLRNVETLQIDVSNIEAAVLSHQHSDHSAGFRSAIPAIAQARKMANKPPLLLSLPVADCTRRGVKVASRTILFSPDNPTEEEMVNSGACVIRKDAEHSLCDGFFYVSGYIPRKTSFETGFPGHCTLTQDGIPVSDEEIAEERYVAVKIRDRGAVVFSACSHAGIINVCNDVVSKSNLPLLGIVGGFHLGGGKNIEERIPATMKELSALDPVSIFAGHCSGFRAKAELAKSFPEKFQPCVVGGEYMFEAPKLSL